MRCLPPAVLVLLFLPAASAPAEPRVASSWGKAGVSLPQFANDASECSETSRTVAVSIRPKTLQQMDALSSAALLDIAMQGSGGADYNPMQIVANVTSQHAAEDIARRSNTFGAKYVAMVRPDVKAELQEVLDKCLMERGYVRIVLNAEQRKRLSKLKHHSAERTAYLHSVDSDPILIERQRLAP